MKRYFKSFNLFLGCVRNGFGIECKNCCALFKARAIRGRKKKTSTIRAFGKAVTREGKKWFWSNKICFNPKFLKELGPIKPRKDSPSKIFMISYFSECSLWPKWGILLTLIMIYLWPRHVFVWLTKNPALLGKKIEWARQRMLECGIDTTKFTNMSFATSIGVKDSVRRIKQLCKAFKLYRKELFCKPLLEDLGKINLSGISVVRISREKGENKRGFDPAWAYAVEAQAIKQGVEVSYKS